MLFENVVVDPVLGRLRRGCFPFAFLPREDDVARKPLERILDQPAALVQLLNYLCELVLGSGLRHRAHGAQGLAAVLSVLAPFAEAFEDTATLALAYAPTLCSKSHNKFGKASDSVRSSEV